MSREVLDYPIKRMSPNRRYRVNVVHEDFGGDKWNGGNKQGRPANKGYEEPDLYGEEDDEEDPAVAQIVENGADGYKLSFHVSKSFYGGLIGLKGQTKRRIEKETQSEMYIPRQHEESSNVTIVARDRSQVCAALRQIRSFVGSLRRKMRPTHFLAVPLNFGEVQNGFLELKKSILEAQFPGIGEELFISEICIHITLGVYVLLDENERKKALEELEFCRSILSDLTTPFEIKVKGLEIMNDDPSSSRILYGCVEAPELQKFADRCLAHFQTTGFAATDNNKRDSIKLHMTVLNNRYSKKANSAAKTPNSFDVRELLKQFGDFDFGTAQCSAVHLCALNSSGADSFYKISGSLKF